MSRTTRLIQSVCGGLQMLNGGLAALAVIPRAWVGISVAIVGAIQYGTGMYNHGTQSATDLPVTVPEEPAMSGATLFPHDTAPPATP
jgi:hypothetical protein